jgi:hypothetical protein
MTKPRRLVLLAVVAVIAAVGSAVAFTGTPAALVKRFDPYPTREIPTECHDVLRPGVVEFRKLLLTQVGGGDSGLYSCRPIEGKTTLSYHADSRAWDWRMNAGSAADRARVNLVLSWLLRTERGVAEANARHLGIGEIIWNHEIVTLWGDNPTPPCHQESDGMSCLRPYDGLNPHTDHVHFSFSVAGADDTAVWSTARGVTPSWYLTNLPPSPTQSIPPVGFGRRDTLPFAGDWDGDGDDTLGFYDPRVRRFYGRNTISAGPPDLVTAVIGPFGAIPFVGDWDGDGADDFGFYLPPTREFHFVDRHGAEMRSPWVFGLYDDVPFVGDWDADDRDDEIGVYRPSRRAFDRQLDSGRTLTTVLGGPGDTPVAGHFDGDGSEDIGVFHVATHTFTLLSSTGPELVSYGDGAVFQVAGDWDGHGRSGLGVALMPVPR